MEALEALTTRRSIRKYSDEPVTEEQERAMLRAAMQAPSAVNRQPWHFVVVRDRELLETLAREHPHGSMLARAGLAVAVCGDLERQHDSDYWIVDSAAATENLLLAAHALGLGAVWLGIFPRVERMAMVKKQLQLPVHVEPLALVAVGHPAETLEPVDRYDEEKVHRDRWGG
jgi:nitroreductase